MMDIDDGGYGEPGGPGGPAAEVEVPKEPRSILKEVVVTVFNAGLVLGAVYAAVQVAHSSLMRAIKHQACPDAYNALMLSEYWD